MSNPKPHKWRSMCDAILSGNFPTERHEKAAAYLEEETKKPVHHYSNATGQSQPYSSNPYTQNWGHV